METILIIAISALIGALLAYLATRASYLKLIQEADTELEELKKKISSQSNEHATAFSSLRATHDSTVGQFETLRASSNEMKNERDKWRGEAIRFEEQLIAEKASHVSSLSYKEKYNKEHEEAQKWQNEATKLGEQLKAQNDSINELKTTKNLFLEEFKKTSNEVLLSTNSKFTLESNEKISSTLGPFKEKLKEFQEMVEKIRNDEIREATDLKGEISSIRTLNEKLSQDANNLAKALKSDNKKAGSWGETTMERLLETSGLNKTLDYVLQGSGMDLRSDEGGLQKPDAIIMLPENKHLIVDCKVSLKSFEKYCSAETDLDREVALGEFVKSVEDHIDDLSNKRYHFIDKLISPDFVYLFIPIEGAFMLYISSGGDYMKHSKDRSICVASPTSLIPNLKTVATLWRHDRQNKNASLIAKMAGDIHDKFAIIETYIDKLDDSLDKSRKHFDDFKSRLSTGKGNVVRSLNNLKVLGAKTGKTIQMEHDDPDKAILADFSEINHDLFDEESIE